MPHNVYFKKGELKNLPSTKSAGTIYVTTDERAMYVDVNDSTRIRLGDFREYATWADIQKLDKTNLSTTALYYAVKENVLCKYTGTAWTQINPDTICQLKENKLTGANVDGGVQITSKITDDKELIKEGSIAIKGGTNVTIAMDGSDVKISAADKETTLAGHYTPVENKGSELKATSGFITAIKRDDKGHVVGIDTSEQTTNAVTGVTTTAAVATGEGKTGIDVTTAVSQQSGDTYEGVLNVVGGGATSVSVDNGSLKVSSTDKSVTAVGNHYVPTGYNASKLSAGAGEVISAVNTDAAGHVTTVTTRQENEVTDLSFSVEAADNGGASISQTIDQKNGTSRTSAKGATIVGDGATTVSVVDGKVQVSTPVSSESNHYQATGASAGTMNASGATGTAKETVQVVTGVTTDKNGHVTGIVSGAATDTHANISEVTATANKAGFDITVKDTDNVSKTATLNPVIKVGSAESSVHFVDGVADLDVYTITETDNKIADALKAANAMVIRGEVNTTKPLPTTNVQAGDTYIVTADGVAFGEGQKLEVGDLLVAKADKATGVGTSDWYYVPAGNDIAYFSPSANAIELKTKSDDVTSGKISFAAPAARESGIKVGMNNTYANNYYTSELTFDMVWGEF